MEQYGPQMRHVVLLLTPHDHIDTKLNCTLTETHYARVCIYILYVFRGEPGRKQKKVVVIPD